MTYFLKIVPTHYKINISPIKNSSDPVRVSCWVKIKANIENKAWKSTNNYHRDTVISLNRRNCALEFKSLTISKTVIGETKEFTIKNNSLKIHDLNEEFSDAPTHHTLQLSEDQVHVGD